MKRDGREILLAGKAAGSATSPAASFFTTLMKVRRHGDYDDLPRIKEGRQAFRLH